MTLSDIEISNIVNIQYHTCIPTAVRLIILSSYIHTYVCVHRNSVCELVVLSSQH